VCSELDALEIEEAPAKQQGRTVGDESELEFLDPSPLPVGTGRGSASAYSRLRASHYDSDIRRLAVPYIGLDRILVCLAQVSRLAVNNFSYDCHRRTTLHSYRQAQ